MDKILEKIQKLLNVTAENGATDEEALTALTKAQELMAKHGIEVSQLSDSTPDENVEEVTCIHKWDAGYRKPLAAIISRNYKCECFMSGTDVVFVGFETDVKVAKAAFEFAYKFIYKRGNQEYNAAVKKYGFGRDVFNSYARGFISGLKEILEAQSKALMIVVPQDVVNFVERTYNLGEASGGMRQQKNYSEYYQKGRDDAKSRFGAAQLSSASIQ